jgi:peroxiredoxin family protein
MKMDRMVVGLASGSEEKLLVAATVIGGAIALDERVDLYLLLGGARAFRRDVASGGSPTYDHPELRAEMEAGMASHQIPSPMAQLRDLKARGELRIHACATAGKIWGAEQLSDFSGLVDDIVGVGEYVLACSSADAVQTF